MIADQYGDGTLITVKGAAMLRRVFPDRNETWRESDEKGRPVLLQRVRILRYDTDIRHDGVATLH